MMEERTGVTKMEGTPVTLLGPQIKPGEQAPYFRCLDASLDEVSFSEFQGKVTILASVPSLDTTVCNKEAIRLNEVAEDLPIDQAAVVVVSMDLPFAQMRFVEDEEARSIHVLSDHRDASFGNAYGVLMKEHRLLCRAVFVADRDGVIRYAEYVPEVSEFPDMDSMLRVVYRLLARPSEAAA
ncbi:MAG TPA: thiol peroxidase [Nitrospirota bacterium]